MVCDGSIHLSRKQNKIGQQWSVGVVVILPDCRSGDTSSILVPTAKENIQQFSYYGLTQSSEKQLVRGSQVQVLPRPSDVKQGFPLFLKIIILGD